MAYYHTLSLLFKHSRYSTLFCAHASDESLSFSLHSVKEFHKSVHLPFGVNAPCPEAIPSSLCLFACLYFMSAALLKHVFRLVWLFVVCWSCYSVFSPYRVSASLPLRIAGVCAVRTYHTPWSTELHVIERREGRKEPACRSFMALGMRLIHVS